MLIPWSKTVTRDFICPHESHENFPSKKHVLVCQDHAQSPENQQILQSYKERCIIRQPDIQSFSKDIKLVFHTSIQSVFISSKEIIKESVKPAINDNAIYILQTIIIDNQRYTIFFDLGCSDMVISEKAVKKLGHRAMLEFKGDMAVGGVDQLQTISSGVYKIMIPLHNGHDAQLSGVCLPNITSGFPIYQLKQVEKDPSLPSSIGGEIDIMLGIKYLRYHPKEVFQLASGLTIFQSMFKNSDGSQGVVGGPHRAFNNINEHHVVSQQIRTFFTTHHQLSKKQSFFNPDVSLLHLKVNKDHQKDLMFNLQDQSTALVMRNQKIFDQVTKVLLSLFLYQFD